MLDGAARAGHADRPLLRSLGSMLRDAGDLRRSAAVLEPLVRDDASDLESADALGQTYARMGRGPQAEAMFKRVLAASPNGAATWNNLGALYLAENRAADAIEALSRAVTINPELATRLQRSRRRLRASRDRWIARSRSGGKRWRCGRISRTRATTSNALRDKKWAAPPFGAALSLPGFNF